MPERTFKRVDGDDGVHESCRLRAMIRLYRCSTRFLGIDRNLNKVSKSNTGWAGLMVQPSISVRSMHMRTHFTVSPSHSLFLLYHVRQTTFPVFQEGFETIVRQWVFPEKVVHAGEEACLTDVINKEHENVKYLPGVKLPENVRAESDLKEAVRSATILVFVLPHQVSREVGREKVRVIPQPR